MLDEDSTVLLLLGDWFQLFLGDGVGGYCGRKEEQWWLQVLGKGELSNLRGVHQQLLTAEEDTEQASHIAAAYDLETACGFSMAGGIIVLCFETFGDLIWILMYNKDASVEKCYRYKHNKHSLKKGGYYMILAKVYACFYNKWRENGEKS